MCLDVLTINYLLRDTLSFRGANGLSRNNRVLFSTLGNNIIAPRKTDLTLSFLLNLETEFPFRNEKGDFSRPPVHPSIKFMSTAPAAFLTSTPEIRSVRPSVGSVGRQSSDGLRVSRHGGDKGDLISLDYG